MTVLLIILLLALLLVLGIPVGYSMGIAGALGLWLYAGESAMSGILATAPYRQSASWILAALPIFILMAEIMARSGLATRLFRATYAWFRRVPGSLAVATVVSTALFGTLTGSSSAATATMAKTAIPEMRKYNYDDRISLGVVASAGSLAMLIPPSIVLIIYGILTEVSIGRLFIAGIIPGALSAILYVGVVLLWVRVNPDIAGGRWRRQSASPPPSSQKAGGPGTGVVSDSVPGLEASKLSSVKDVGPTLLLFAAVIGSIYSGVATITEAASVGAAGALLLAMLGGSFGRREFWEALKATARTTGMIFVIIIGAHIFGYFMTMTGTTQSFVNLVAGMQVAPWVIIAIFLLMYLLLGFVMDQLAVLVLTVPLVFPVIVELGFDPIWFGILIIKTVEIGLATPPLGLNVFIATSVSGVTLGNGFRGVARFVFADLGLLIILALFPAITLALL